MGSWGAGAFDNDSAADWAADLGEGGRDRRCGICGRAVEGSTSGAASSSVSLEHSEAAVVAPQAHGESDTRRRGWAK